MATNLKWQTVNTNKQYSPTRLLDQSTKSFSAAAPKTAKQRSGFVHMIVRGEKTFPHISKTSQECYLSTDLVKNTKLLPVADFSIGATIQPGTVLSWGKRYPYSKRRHILCIVEFSLHKSFFAVHSFLKPLCACTAQRKQFKRY